MGEETLILVFNRTLAGFTWHKTSITGWLFLTWL